MLLKVTDLLLELFGSSNLAAFGGNLVFTRGSNCCILELFGSSIISDCSLFLSDFNVSGYLYTDPVSCLGTIELSIVELG